MISPQMKSKVLNYFCLMKILPQKYPREKNMRVFHVELIDL